MCSGYRCASYAQGICVDIRVVSKYVDACDRHVDCRTGCVRVGNGGVVYGGNSDVHRGCGRTPFSVCYGVREACGAIVIGVGLEYHVAPHNGDAAIYGSLYRLDGQRIAVYIGIIAEQCCRCNSKRRVFRSGDRVVCSNRRVVDWRHIDRDAIGRRVECTAGVLHGEIETCVVHTVGI